MIKTIIEHNTAFLQVFMYGVKIKPYFERFLDPIYRPPIQPYIFDTARQYSNDGGGGDGGEVPFSQVDSGGVLINYTLMYTRYPRCLMGLEILFFYDINAGNYSYLAFYPQVQLKVTNEVKVYVGPGLVFTPKRIFPEFATRVLIETDPEEEEKEKLERLKKEKGTETKESKEKGKKEQETIQKGKGEEEKKKKRQTQNRENTT